MKYEKLEKAAREPVITNFLRRVNGGRGLADIDTEDVNCLASVSLNGRQVSGPPCCEQNF